MSPTRASFTKPRRRREEGRRGEKRIVEESESESEKKERLEEGKKVTAASSLPTIILSILVPLLPNKDTLGTFFSGGGLFLSGRSG